MTLDGTAYHRLLRFGAVNLEKCRETTNALNVFPVPDGDTGTNMSMTLNAIYALPETIVSAAESSAAAARAMMRAARGNSGVMLSLFFRGIARVFDGHEKVSPTLFCEAIREGARSAASAVEKPVEGTILTVMRECADFSDSESDTFETVMERVYDRAEHTLAQTPELLPTLKRAHVVDSGGYGFVRILEGMKAALTGKPLPDAAQTTAASVHAPAAAAEEADEDVLTYPFCTECLLDLEGALAPEILEELREKLRGMGNSMVLTADEEILKLHIHTDRPLEILTLMLPLGAFRTSKIENMKLQHDGIVKEKKAAVPKERRKLGLFAVSPGTGFDDLFKELGADAVISGGQSMNPSSDDLLKAIEAYPCEEAILLPNNHNILLAAKQAAELCRDTQIHVIPTKTLPQGVTALFAYNAARTPAENVEEMSEAMTGVRTYSITRAVRDAQVDDMSVRERQFLGLSENKVVTAADTLDETFARLAEKIGECDLLTVYYGKDVKKEAAEKAAAVLTELLPDCGDISVVSGGQPIYSYILSAE